MAGKISELTAAASVAGTDEVEVLTGGANKRGTFAMVMAYIRGIYAATPATVAEGGTGRVTGTTAYGLVAAGTTATGAQQTLAAGATTEVLVGGGAAAVPVWTAATGSGAPVRATSPTLVTPILGTPTSGTLTNCTIPVGGVTGLGTGVDTLLAAAADGSASDGPGYRGVPIHSFSADTNIAASDNGKMLIHPSSDANARTLTIPANGTLAADHSSVIYNDSASNVTLAITTDTLVQVVTGTTGSITIPQYGYVFIKRIASTRWIAVPVVS